MFSAVVIMQKITLTLITIADGKETRETYEAELKLENDSALLRYQTDDGISKIALAKGYAEVERTGEYALFLPLKEGEASQGRLSVQGASGSLALQTDSVEYSQNASGIMFRLKYRLLFNEEKQEMRVSGYARINGEKK